MAQNDVLKRYLDAGLEFRQLTQSRAEALVRDLVKRGEVQADQARDAVADLVARSRKNSEQLLETVRKEVRAQVTERGLVSKADLDKVEARIAKLFGSGVTATKKAAKKAAPAKKKATTKKAAARKTVAAKKKATTKKAPARKAPAKKRA